VENLKVQLVRPPGRICWDMSASAAHYGALGFSCHIFAPYSRGQTPPLPWSVLSPRVHLRLGISQKAVTNYKPILAFPFTQSPLAALADAPFIRYPRADDT
jgi:hypothetical protein